MLWLDIWLIFRGFERRALMSGDSKLPTVGTYLLLSHQSVTFSFAAGALPAHVCAPVPVARLVAWGCDFGRGSRGYVEMPVRIGGDPESRSG